MTKTIVGVWCGAGSKLMEQVHGLPVLQRVIKRIGSPIALVPWTTDLDWMEGHGWMKPLRRCHPDERLAMRDLVVTLCAEAGAIIQGDCLTIDKEEIALAFACIERGLGAKRGGAKPIIESLYSGAFYVSPRIQAFKASDLVAVFDTNEWGPYPLSAQEFQRQVQPNQVEMRWARIERAQG